MHTNERKFVYEALPTRVIFGAGSVDKVREELERLGIQRALVPSTPEQKERGTWVADRAGAAGIFARAVMHVPSEVARAAREEARDLVADGCVAVGGGSTTGLAKAIALETKLPILAIPTTY